ncbi:hypothetical protein [Agitococcus lubricus]|uniref:Uncharacterized protein n=1 Tax=Agitococcus lubricus TaxID=1077255 RepID=A0A2T5J0E4_9GAMM|nr:hypothetical protein [Agitococcus lubricus]PTQ89818.1 hypothetical protein C8N29_105145 [Agitococcus lubricus]
MFIKFQREARYQPRGVTSQRLAATKRKFKKEQERLPLFALEIEEQQPEIESYILSKDEQIIKHEIERRKLIADRWRLARKIVRCMPIDVRNQVIERWHGNRYMPKTSFYFIDMLYTHFREYYEVIEKAA